MTIRTFKQLGQAYGSSPVQIIAKIDDVEVFNGVVSALDEPVPMLPTDTPIVSQELFSWTADVDFDGTQALEITAIGGTVLLTDSVANYGTSEIEIPAAPPFPNPVSIGPDAYAPFYANITEDTWDVDYLKDVAINGIPLVKDNSPELIGQWIWTINNGKVLTGVIHVTAGLVGTKDYYAV
jgi:hypothetical protein